MNISVNIRHTNNFITNQELHNITPLHQVPLETKRRGRPPGKGKGKVALTPQTVAYLQQNDVLPLSDPITFQTDSSAIAPLSQRIVQNNPAHRMRILQKPRARQLI